MPSAQPTSAPSVTCPHGYADDCSPCQDGGKIIELRLVLEQTYSSSNTQGSKTTLFGGLSGLAGPFDIEIADKDDNIVRIVEGVNFGHVITFEAGDFGASRLPSEARITVYSRGIEFKGKSSSSFDCVGDFCARIHTSCSVPLEMYDTFGHFRVDGFLNTYNARETDCACADSSGSATGTGASRETMGASTTAAVSVLAVALVVTLVVIVALAVKVHRGSNRNKAGTMTVPSAPSGNEKFLWTMDRTLALEESSTSPTNCFNPALENSSTSPTNDETKLKTDPTYDNVQPTLEGDKPAGKALGIDHGGNIVTNLRSSALGGEPMSTDDIWDWDHQDLLSPDLCGTGNADAQDADNVQQVFSTVIGDAMLNQVLDRATDFELFENAAPDAAHGRNNEPDAAVSPTRGVVISPDPEGTAQRIAFARSMFS